MCLFTKETYLLGGHSIACNKGALVLAVLREQIGDDALLQTLKSWVAENGGNTGTTEAFVALAERVSGQNLTEYANAWLYGSEKFAEFPIGGVVNGGGAANENNAVTDTHDDDQNGGTDAWIAVIIGIVAAAAVAVGVVIFKKKKS